jgi:hypothetical protein
MTYSQFITLNYKAQATRVWDGVFLGDRRVRDNYILLYELGGFYVEVYYSMTLHQIVRIRPFKVTTLLGPYLDQMTFESLNKLLL